MLPVAVKIKCYSFWLLISLIQFYTLQSTWLAKPSFIAKRQNQSSFKEKDSWIVTFGTATFKLLKFNQHIYTFKFLPVPWQYNNLWIKQMLRSGWVEIRPLLDVQRPQGVFLNLSERLIPESQYNIYTNPYTTTKLEDLSQNKYFFMISISDMAFQMLKAFKHYYEVSSRLI